MGNEVVASGSQDQWLESKKVGMVSPIAPMTRLIDHLCFFAQHGRLPLRERYWKRGDGRWRVRYALAGYASGSALASFTALSLFPLFSAPVEQASMQMAALAARGQPEIVAAAPSIPVPVIPVIAGTQIPATTAVTQVAAVTPMPGVLNEWRGPDGQIRRSADVKSTAAVVRQVEGANAPKRHRLTIAAGDTLSSLLVQAGMTSSDAHSAIAALRKHVKPSDLRPGQILDLDLKNTAGGPEFSRLALAIDPVRTVEVKRGFAGFYNAQIAEKPLKRDIAANVAVVKASLYGSAEAAGIPASVTAEAIRAFSHQIDFQRDIQPGDRMEIMYDRMVTDDGYVARNGNIVFAKLMADGREIAIYRYETRDGRVDYFDDKGRSIRKALLRTPMDGVRISSGYGMRRHPILGYSKMHKGVDFSASTGTPIYAAGDGVVEKAGRFSSYGNYVRIRHSNNLKTAYAHMSRFATGVRPGTRVRQGQVIGYVGSTGRSTGPHLHYEVLMNDTQVNPNSMKLPTMVALDGQDLKKFKEMVRRLDQDFKSRTSGLRYASANADEADNLLVR